MEIVPRVLIPFMVKLVCRLSRGSMESGYLLWSDIINYGKIITDVACYAAVNFIQNHPPGHDSKGANLPAHRDKTGSQRSHPREIKLDNFTNVFINCI